METFSVYLFSIVACITLWVFCLRHIHVGCGMILCHDSKESIYVQYVFPGSPAWFAEVRPGMRLLAINDKKMKFSSHKKFYVWQSLHAPMRGKKDFYSFDNGLLVSIEPEIIFKKYRHVSSSCSQ